MGYVLTGHRSRTGSRLLVLLLLRSRHRCIAGIDWRLSWIMVGMGVAWQLIKGLASKCTDGHGANGED